MKINQTKSVHNRNKKIGNGEIYSEIKRKEQQEKEERLKFLELLSESICLPPDVLNGVPIIKMHGRSALYIENYKKISEYNEERIVIQTGVCQVLIEGKRLKMDFFSKSEIKISGVVKAVSYLNH